MIASCEPATGLLASEYARETEFRLLVLQRGGGPALSMLKQGLVHVAGVHRSPTASFVPVRTESLDFCFAETQAHDPRLQALVRLLRSRAHRRLLSELPGYDARHTGEMAAIG